MPPSVLDAIDEVQGFRLEGLSVVETGCPHITRSITHQHLVNSFWTGSHSYAFVVNLELVTRFKVVIQDHLFAPADQRVAHFNWRQPVDVNVSNLSIRKKQSDVSDILGLARHVT